MLILLCILAILLIVLLLRVGADAAYDAEGFRLSMIIGAFRLQLIPAKQKKAKTGDGKAKADKSAQKAKKKRKFTFDLRFVFDLIRLVLQALNRLRICLCAEVFELRFISASDDPYKTAMNSAYVTTALNMLAPQAKRAFRVKKSSVEVGTDFFEDKSKITARLALTIRIWQILYVALSAGIAFLAARRRYKKRAALKAAKENEKAVSEKETADNKS